MFGKGATPFWWPSRMKRSFESVYRKVQDADRSTLHLLRWTGTLEGFVLSYLGAMDETCRAEGPIGTIMLRGPR